MDTADALYELEKMFQRLSDQIFLISRHNISTHKMREEIIPEIRKALKLAEEIQVDIP